MSVEFLQKEKEEDEEEGGLKFHMVGSKVDYNRIGVRSIYFL